MQHIDGKQAIDGSFQHNEVPTTKGLEAMNQTSGQFRKTELDFHTQLVQLFESVESVSMMK